jgi:SNF2-related domain/Zinc finger, C3HC4 type (RING finger)/Helicase conserved C-terminal domain
MATFLTEQSSVALKILNQAYINELTNESSRVETANIHLKVPLRAHQAAAVHSMLEQEKRLSTGMDISGETLYGAWSILGDGVGVGKSLSVLGQIAHLKAATAFSPKMPRLSMPCSPYLYSMEKQTYTDLSDCNACLIVVPHTLYRQWCGYIKDQTNLKTFYVTTKKNLEGSFWTNLNEADVILISNTLYKDFMYKTSTIVRFRRVYIDEADSIHISGSLVLPQTKFIWLISASWPNLLYPGINLWIGYHLLHTHVFSEGSIFHPDFTEQFRSNYLSRNPYYTFRYHVVSTSFLRRLLLPNHPLRGHLVLRCSSKFIAESISLPPLHRHTILCRSPISYQLVSGVISPEVRNFLHAGDIQSALQLLGVGSEQKTSLVDAVTENRTKALAQLKRDYAYKAEREYSTPQAKEEALTVIRSKISHLEEQINSIKERIENYQKEVCPICFDEPQDAVLTKCCQRIFCAACILQSLARKLDCPLCRKITNPTELKRISETNSMETVKPKEETAQPPLKKEALINLFKENPTGKFLVFSRYDNPFIQITNELEALGIHGVREVKGSKDMIQSTLNMFQRGDLRCLLLNSMHAGAGLTITAATHIILLHSMNVEEEKQILGRAYRLGRKEPLSVYKLVHPDEMENAG